MNMNRRYSGVLGDRNHFTSMLMVNSLLFFSCLLFEGDSYVTCFVPHPIPPPDAGELAKGRSEECACGCKDNMDTQAPETGNVLSHLHFFGFEMQALRHQPHAFGV